MSEEMLVTHCSPTLAGLKTGNLFNCPYDSREQIHREICYYNKILVPKGLCILPLRYGKDRVLIYLYRRNRLENDLGEDIARELLKKCGYREGSAAELLRQLIRRLQNQTDFPHEIGLFLGYPPEDVKGFIEQGADASIATGFWRVYTNPEQAEKTFSLFRRCTTAYGRQLMRGQSIERLIVAANS